MGFDHRELFGLDGQLQALGSSVSVAMHLHELDVLRFESC